MAAAAEPPTAESAAAGSEELELPDTAAGVAPTAVDPPPTAAGTVPTALTAVWFVDMM